MDRHVCEGYGHINYAQRPEERKDHGCCIRIFFRVELCQCANLFLMLRQSHWTYSNPNHMDSVLDNATFSSPKYHSTWRSVNFCFVYKIEIMFSKTMDVYKKKNCLQPRRTVIELELQTHASWSQKMKRIHRTLALDIFYWIAWLGRLDKEDTLCIEERICF